MKKLVAFINNMDAQVWRTVWVSLALMAGVIAIIVLATVTGFADHMDEELMSLRESGDAAALSGAGLEWSGSVSEKEGGQGQTLTLDGPTAAQLERGFDVGGWDVEPGVYAVAQRDSGEVLHVTTQTLVPQDQERASEEMTLGTVYAFQDDVFSGFAYYLDRREEGSDRVTRTYVRPGQEPYRVGYEAPAMKQAGGSDDRNGAFVPLLVGWRGFEDTPTTGEE